MSMNYLQASITQTNFCEIASTSFTLKIRLSTTRIIFLLFDRDSQIFYYARHGAKDENESAEENVQEFQQSAKRRQNIYSTLLEVCRSHDFGDYKYGDLVQSQSANLRIEKQKIIVKRSIKKGEYTYEEQLNMGLKKIQIQKMGQIFEVYLEGERKHIWADWAKKYQEKKRESYEGSSYLQKQQYNLYTLSFLEIKQMTDNIMPQNAKMKLPIQQSQSKSMMLDSRIQSSISNTSTQTDNLLQQNDKLKKIIQNHQQRIQQLKKTQYEFKESLNIYRGFFPSKAIKLIQSQQQQSTDFETSMISISNQHPFRRETEENISNDEIQNVEQKLIQARDHIFKFFGEKQNKMFESPERIQRAMSQVEDIRNNREQALFSKPNTDLEEGRGIIQRMNSNQNSQQGIFYKDNPYFSQFQIQNRKVRYVGSAFTRLFGGWCQIMVNQIVPRDTTYRFQIKILKSDRRAIIIGIVDRKKEGQSKTPDEANTIGYYGRWGKLIPTGTEQGTGFFQGETVRVKVQALNKTIKWSVGREMRAKTMHPNLGDPNRQFVPYIEMRHSEDIVEWCGSKRGSN